MKNALFAEEKIVDVQAIADVSTVLTNYADLKKGFRVAFVIAVADSVAATFKPKFQQRKGTAAPKNLNICNAYYVKKKGASVYTKVEVDAENLVAEIDLSTDLGTDGGIVIFEVLAEDLDVNNDFDQVAISFDTSAVVKPASVTTVIEPKYLPAYK